MADLPEVQDRSGRLFEDLLRAGARAPRAAGEEAEAVPSAPRFSVFAPEQAAAASELALGLSVVAAAATDPAEGLDDALTQAAVAAQTEDPELVHHALALFVTHSTEGRRLIMPRTLVADPGSFTPSRFAADETVAPAVEAAAAGSTGAERRLDFWREDALANRTVQLPGSDAADFVTSGGQRLGEAAFGRHQHHRSAALYGSGKPTIVY